MGLQKIGSKAERETRMCHMNNLKSVKAERTQKKNCSKHHACMQQQKEQQLQLLQEKMEQQQEKMQPCRKQHKADSAGSYLHSSRLT